LLASALRDQHQIKQESDEFAGRVNASILMA
jgi:hypothetical protein